MTQKIDIQMYNECSGAHTHDYPQILLPLGRAMQIMIGSEDYRVTPQELCFVPAGMAHRCDYRDRLLALNLSEELLDERDFVMLSYPLIVSMGKQTTRLVELIQAELTQNPESRAVHHLYRYLYGKLIESSAAPSIRYIATHYDCPITVEQLARLESYNVTYFNDWFKQKTGFSPSLYLRCTRIDRAKELLATTNFSVMEIAVMVGYSSNSTFTRAFHNVTGMTPKAYRDDPSRKKLG